MRALALTFLSAFLVSTALASTEPTKQLGIDKGLGWLAATQVQSGPEGYWPYADNGTLATTATAALAFIEEGYLPGNDVIILGTNYGDVVGRAVTYMFNRATVDARFGVEYAVYERYAEDYNNDGDYTNDGGNGQAIFFSPGASNRNMYTTGICVPVVYALGEALGKDTVIGFGVPPVSGMTYAEAMQDLIDWFVWGQVEPDRGVYRGGWRYDANYSSSDNSTAQWGSLPLLYAHVWGLGFPQYVRDELDLWVTYIQNPNGGSGYDTPTSYVNMSKTGGLLMQFAVIGDPIGSPRVQAALGFINDRWNTSINNTWYGNFNNAYAMWAVYKALGVYGMTSYVTSGGEDILIGHGMPAAPGGFTIGQDWDPVVTLPGDWYSHYCDALCGMQNVDGSWTGASYWTGPLATGWYINIINAAGALPQQVIAAEVDIVPRACPNPLVMESDGILRVAILGTADFDVMEIDPATLSMAGVAPFGWAYNDIAAPYLDKQDVCDCVEVPNDLYMDMILRFRIPDLVAVIGAVSHKEMVPMTVTGKLMDGLDFAGADCAMALVGRPDLVLAELGLGVTGGSSGKSPSIQLRLPAAGPVELAVYDVAGRLVERLDQTFLSAGTHVIEWDSSEHSAGVYFLRAKAGTETVTHKMVVLR
jgi:hypothetical protein